MEKKRPYRNYVIFDEDSTYWWVCQNVEHIKKDMYNPLLKKFNIDYYIDYYMNFMFLTPYSQMKENFKFSQSHKPKSIFDIWRKKK